MTKKGKFQSPVSALMAVAILEQISKCKDKSVEAVKKDVADAFDLVSRAFSAYEEGVANAQKQEAKTEKIEDTNKSTAPASTKVDEELVKSRSEVIDAAFNAYNQYAVIIAKYAGHKVSEKHLTKIAKRITRICLRDIEGLDLDNIEAKISGMEKGEGKLSLVIRTVDDEEV